MTNPSERSSTGQLHLVTTSFELSLDCLAMVTLDLDHTIFDGTACAASTFQFARQLLYRILAATDTRYRRDRLPSPATRFAAEPQEAVRRRRIVPRHLSAETAGLRLGTARADPAVLAGEDKLAARCRDASLHRPSANTNHPAKARPASCSFDILVVACYNAPVIVQFRRPQ